jgi:hypothetical protein
MDEPPNRIDHHDRSNGEIPLAVDWRVFFFDWDRKKLFIGKIDS